MANSITVTRKLQQQGFPVSLTKGKSCFFFTLTHKDTMETFAVRVTRFHSFSEKEWMDIGKAFSTRYFIRLVEAFNGMNE